MTLTQSLKSEIREPVEAGYVFAPQYYKGQAFLVDDPSLDIPARRALAIEYLFTKIRPHIYPSDRIVGCLRPVMVKNDETLEKYSKAFFDIGDRWFGTGYDHFASDYWYVCEKGIPGMIEDIEASMKVHADDEDRVRTLRNMKTAMEAFRTMVEHYRETAVSLQDNEAYDAEALSRIIGNLDALLAGAPQNFEQALQLVWLCHISFCTEGRYAMALGRIDQYLYPFYKRDVECGLLDDDKATELLANIFMKIGEVRTTHGGDDVANICIGGSSPDGSTDVNPLSYCVLHAVRDCNIPGPNLSARISSTTPEEFLDECLKVIGTGLGYPALMNDGTIIPALSHFPYDKKDVYNYCMVGCIENFIPGKQPPWSDGRFDPPVFFEHLFNHGKGIKCDRSYDDPGDVETIGSMDEFMERYSALLRKGIKEYADNFNAYMKAHPAYDKEGRQEDYTSPFLSCFCRECIERGKDINLGGTKYPSNHGAAVMGIGTTCDALAAVEKTVFVDHTATLAEIRDAILCNFEGREELRKLLLAAPKYGNNDDFVDKYAKWFVDFMAEEFYKYRTNDNGYIITLMAANTSNIDAGYWTAATPDGRLAGEAYSDASSPSHGRDVSGVTSTLLSCCKPDYTKVAGGTVLNQRFLPSIFKDGKREKLRTLIRTFFDMGGQEVQINATSSETLRDAMDHPENYGSLVVRVSGFSAYYVTLGKEVQNDILNRTLQEG